MNDRVLSSHVSIAFVFASTTTKKDTASQLLAAMEAPGPSTTSTVSASGVEAIESTIEVKPQVQISEVPLEDVYEVDRTVEEIKRGGWTKVRRLNMPRRPC